MESLKGKFTRIEGSYSQVRRLPRLGKIRLGIKVQKMGKQGTVEYPKETPWFVCPPEVEAVYGKEPMELDVMLPHEDPEVFFPQKLAMYGSTAGLKCHGNGRVAERLDEKGNWNEMACPCPFLKSSDNPKGPCTEQSSLMVLLPKVSMGGCYQITTGSYHSTVTINSALDYIRALAGRVALIPLKLRRVPRTTHNDGKSQTHYTLELILDGDLKMIRELRADAAGVLIPARYQIEGPIDENKTLDPVDETEVDAEDLADADEQELEQIQEKLREAQAKKTTEPTETKDTKETKEPKKPDPAPSESAPPNGHTLIAKEDWESIIVAIDEVFELVTIKKAWKEKNRVKNVMALNAVGQQAFLSYLREEAKKIGLPVPF